MKVTFVMPAYNAAKYIEEAVNSIMAQTVADWELIIVDDGSTDNTLKLALQLAEADSRIRVLSMKEGSGSAYQPRKKAILESSTEWVSPLDADDWIESDYLEKLILQQKQTDADIIYPTMWNPEKNKITTPKDKTFFERKFSGKECIQYTLDGWRINCNGGLIRKSLYEQAFSTFDSSVTYSCADEFLGRQLFSITPWVAFSDAKYFYRPNEESITRKESIKLFDFLKNTQGLIPFVKDIYGKDSEEYLLAHRQNFHAYFDALRVLNRYNFSEKDKEKACSLIRKTKEMVDKEVLKGKASKRYRALLGMPLGMCRIILKIIDSNEFAGQD